MKRRHPGVAFLCLIVPAAAGAQEARTERVVAGERFRASGFHRFLFGADYRDLWTTPVELPVLDLQRFAGGLTPVRRLGHGQTRALALKGADGRSYTFRAVLKDPAGLLPPELQETVAVEFVRDQMASQHPAGHVIVPPLVDAVGLRHNTPRLVVMPDDPALGEFRAEFKNLPGDIEEYTGQAGFGGATEIVEGADLWKRLDAGPATRVDERAYLRARLVDHLVGDWDRHREQWRWARFPGQDLLQPIPEDRDQAFVKFQGFVLAFVRPGLPLLVDFGPEYPSLEGLVYDGWDLDRRLLSGLDRAAWDEVAADVKARITDAVIEEAVGRMPAAYREKNGAWMASMLKRRRDAIPAQAARFYRFLARQVDVRATDADDRAEIERFQGGDLEIRLSARGEGGAAPYFRRRFLARETREVRLHLQGGSDQATVSGPRGGIQLRIVGGGGSDVVDDSKTGGARVSDSDDRDDVRRGPGTRWDRRVYTPPPPPARGSWIPPRDWGRRTLFPVTRLTGSSDLGGVINVGLITTGFGFRQHPYADRQTLRFSYATEPRGFRGTYDGTFHLENAQPFLRLSAKASGIEILHFYGYGNETTETQPKDFYRVEQRQYTLASSLAIPLGKRGELSLGPVVTLSDTNLDEVNLIAQLRPYGSDRFGHAGAVARLALDRTDSPGLPERGASAWVAGSVYPGVWDADGTFGSVRGEVKTYATARPLTLTLSAGGARVWGRYPFHEAAYLGGSASLRGLRSQRYAGDGMLYGSAELRIALGRAFILVPGQLGLLGAADIGRVYLEGEDSNRWHHGLGGGLYFASPQRNNAVSLIIARSETRTAFYLRTSLGF